MRTSFAWDMLFIYNPHDDVPERNESSDGAIAVGSELAK